MADVYADMLAGQLGILGYAPTREYRFAPPRRWRVDVAFLRARLAVEVNGGVWMRGRHNTGQGYTRDLEKLNALTEAGWRVLQYTPQQVTDGTALAQIARVMGDERG